MEIPTILELVNMPLVFAAEHRSSADGGQFIVFLFVVMVIIGLLAELFGEWDKKEMRGRGGTQRPPSSKNKMPWD